MTKIVVVTADVLGEKMAGPAIRAWQMATVLCDDHEVKLISTATSPANRTSANFQVVSAETESELRPFIDWADVLVFQGLLLSSQPWILEEDVIIVADLYDPMHLEQLEQTKGKSQSERSTLVALTSRALDVQIRRADFMLCASEKQRLFWLGQLAANGRINPYTYDDDGLFKKLLAIAPFGIESTPPQQRQHAIKGVIPGITLEDEVLIWGGGIYNWFDPLTLVRAMALLADRRPQVKLFFMGSGHPNPDVPQMAVAGEASRLAEELNLLEKNIFFNEGWVDYDERANYLLDASIGVSTHHLHVETEFSFRTRILDYLWCGLPIVSTEGDGFADLVRDHNLGRVVPESNPEALADAILSLLDTGELKIVSDNVRKFAQQFEWEKVLNSLKLFCDMPEIAPDRRKGAIVSSPTELEIRALKLQISGMESGRVWRALSGIRKKYAKWREQRGMNPSQSEKAAFLASNDADAMTVEELMAFIREERAD